MDKLQRTMQGYTINKNEKNDKNVISYGVDPQHAAAPSSSFNEIISIIESIIGYSLETDEKASLSERYEQIIEVCDTKDIEEVALIILYFLIRYRECFERPHPEISSYDMSKYVQAIVEPYAIKHRSDPEIVYAYLCCDFDDYVLLIDRYFEDDLKCDYTLRHFLSGDIRQYRYFQTIY